MGFGLLKLTGGFRKGIELLIAQKNMKIEVVPGTAVTQFGWA